MLSDVRRFMLTSLLLILAPVAIPTLGALSSSAFFKYDIDFEEHVHLHVVVI